MMPGLRCAVCDGQRDHGRLLGQYEDRPDLWRCGECHTPVHRRADGTAPEHLKWVYP